VAVATVDNTGLVTGITAGTTTITYTNSNGCIITEVVLVKSPPTAVVNSPIACLGATVTLTATSGLPGTYSYAWTVPLGAVPPGDVASFTTSVAGTYSVVLTDIITTCSSTSASGIVTLNAIPFAVATPLGQTICSGQTTGISLSSSVFGTVFNWTAVQVDATGATSGTGGIISQALTATGLVPATVSYTVIPTANGCTGPAMVVTITVMPTPVATATPVVQTICSGGTTAIVLTSDLALPTFNWNVIQTGVTGASAGSGSTINQVLSAIGNSVGEAVYSITPIVSGCPGTPITVSITVNPIPVITASPSTATICSGETTNISLSSTLAGTTYNWSVIQTGVLGALPGSGSSISQVLTTVGILPGSVQYTITPITGGCIGLPITVTITVNPTPELFAFATAGICSGESPNITLSPNLPATTFAWTVVQTGVSGALDGTGASIDQVLTNTGTNPGTVVYTVTPSANGCSGTAVDITVTVDPLPLPAIQPGVICVEEASGIAFQTYELNTQLSGSTHTFVWYLNGVIIPGAAGSSYEALEAGSYSVIATNNTTGCISLPLSVTVSETFPGQGITTTQTLAFADNAQVTVEVTGTGVYEYQLDNGMFQSSNIFENVGIGPHTIWVRDTDGCTDLTTTIYIIGYPHYFTPNGDGVHDQWNIIGLSNQPNAKIYIFDRYGKLIKQISPTSQGWDGTRNGEPLPATDYWFTVDYFEAGTDKVFKSHFSLKR
jgi:gliding motility-associated-like protein